MVDRQNTPKAKPPRVEGLAHLFAAAGYSIDGVRRLWKEAAFRHEVLVYFGALGLLAFLKASLVEFAILTCLFLGFLALISLSLAIINLLPIPILDGGHLLYYLIELIKGSPVSERSQIAGQYVGLMMLVALMGLAFYNDILRLIH